MKLSHLAFCCRVLLTAATFIFGETALLFAEDGVQFNRDIRPILSDACFVCHGPDVSKAAGGLRLDMSDKATAELDSGARAIVPGDVGNSELIARITAEDADLRMPPKDSGKTLTAQQVALLKQWISEGAKYEGHWAFTSPVRPAVPELADVTANTATTNPIDRFILARLQLVNLQPAPRADKETLLRRVTLDLIGLPPTIAEMDAFLADDSPQAYEKVVDRLLLSPAYGERMALPWLDYARYADSNGFQSDGSRDLWAWRDWVIDAYNRNLPFDQFTIEQLAGDLLPNPTQDQIVATGFNRNHRLNGEGGRIVEEWFVETVIDRVETTGMTWLGLTFNCCRCHDHKYDPITQKEFYQLFAFFNSNDESGVLAPAGKNGENTPPLLSLKRSTDDAELVRLTDLVQQRQEKIASLQKDLTQEQAARELAQAAALTNKVSSADWQILADAEVKSLGGASFQKLEDGSWLPGGKTPGNDVYEFASPLENSQLTALLLEFMPDPSQPNESLGRGFNGNFVLTDVLAEITSPNLKSAKEIEFATITADYEQPGWPAQAIANNKASRGSNAKDRKGWAIDGNDPEKRITRRLLLFTKQPLEVPTDATLKIKLRHDSQFPDHNSGRFRVSVTNLPVEKVAFASSALPPAVRESLLVKPAERTAAQKKTLTTYFRENASQSIKQAEAELKQAQQQLKDFRDNLPVTMVMKEVAPRKAFLLKRGEYDQPGEQVERKLPAFLPALPDGAPVNRLGLAQWIVAENNPLTARVWVNRAWEQFFGTGLVKTTENFGSQSEYPSHPALLDWLACEFMQPTVSPAVNGTAPQKWDMKALQKLIVMSDTYQQSSRVTPELIARDAENRLLARGPRVRLPGELIRDQALAVSGLLVPTIGGPSVRPYMPPGVWDETSKYGNLRNYKHESGPGLYRRTMYTIWKRTAAPPTMLLFDAPNREICTIKRSKTNTPLQALSLLNEVTFVEAARKLAERMLRDGGDSPESRVKYGFRVTLGRLPTPAELKVLTEGLAADLKAFEADPENAKKFGSVGESKPTAEMATAELAAYSLTANVLLNLDEFVTKE